jgi:hypothetical protein
MVQYWKVSGQLDGETHLFEILKSKCCLNSLVIVSFLLRHGRHEFLETNFAAEKRRDAGVGERGQHRKAITCYCDYGMHNR